jgi:hypothetical protein
MQLNPHHKKGNPMSDAQTPAVVDNPSENRFETTVDGHTAKVDYKLEDKNITLTHTTVPEELQGRGLAGKLVQKSIESARERNLKVTPVCEVVIGYMKKRPETHDLLSEEGKKAIQ